MAHPSKCRSTAVIIRATSALLFFLASPTVLLSQSSPPQSDPYAVSLAQQSISALTAGNTVSDLTLNGNATWIAGSETGVGTVLLRAKGLDESRVDLNVGNASRSEVRNDSAGEITGETTYANGLVVPTAAHNTTTVAAWFAPSIVVSDFLRADALLTYVARETYAGSTAEHIRMSRTVSSKASAATAALFVHLTTMDLWLDANSKLPISLRFASHPDDDASVDIAVEIRFANYQSFDGILVPQRVVRLLENSVNLDLTISSANFNSGLADSDFAIQTNGGGQ